MNSQTARSAVILIAEDDGNLQGLVSKVLAKYGYQCHAVGCGEEAIDFLLGDNDVDLMLLDYSLGDMNGAELVSTLSLRGVSVPFVVTTGQGSEAVAVEMMKKGAMDYILKDTSFLELLPSVVNRVLIEISIEDRLNKTEEALKREKTHLLNNIPDMVFQIDSEGTFLSMNPAVTQILGYFAPEILGRPVREFLAQDDISFAKKMIASLVDRQQVMEHHIKFRHKDGSIKLCEGSVVPVYNENGLQWISAIYKDVTQEKLVNDELRQAEERLRLVLNSSPNVILELNKHFRVITANQEARQFFKLSSKELLDMYYPHFFSEEWVDNIADALQKALQGNTNHITAQLSDADGKTYWFDTVYSPLRDEFANVTGLLVTSWDVSERVARENTIRDTLRTKERLADEASILQKIATSAGSGVDIKPENVIKSTIKHCFEYLNVNEALGYLLDSNQKFQRVVHKNVEVTALKQIDRFINLREVLHYVLRMRSIRIVYEIPSENVIRRYFKNAKLPSSLTVAVPLINLGRIYAVLIFVFHDNHSLRNAMDFLRSVSQCAGLAVANARTLEDASANIKDKIDILHKLDSPEIKQVESKQLTDSLTSIVEAGINFVRARAGLVLLVERGGSVLKPAAFAGFEPSEIEELTIPRSNSISWRSIDKHKPIYCPDILKAQKYTHTSLSSLAESSLLCVPLVENDVVEGIIAIVDIGVDVEKNVLMVLETFASLAIESMKNSRLAARASELDQRLEDIRAMSKTISLSSNINSILFQVCKASVDALQAEMAWVGTISHDSKSINYVTHAGAMGEYIQKSQIKYDDSPKGCGPTGTAVKTKSPAVVNCIYENENLAQLEAKYGFKSCCAVPIMSNTDVIGTLTLFHSKEDFFNVQNVSILEEFSTQAAMAISNIELRRHLAESESLRNIILQSMNNAMVVIDWEGNVVTVNHAATNLFDKRVQELTNQYYSDVFSEQDLISNVIEKWLLTRTEKETAEGWVSNYGNQKKYIIVEASTVIIEQLPCLLLSLTDLTMQKKMNASLEHAAKLSTVGRVAMQIAHEVGNPLTLISSKIQRLSQGSEVAPEQIASLMPHIDRVTNLIKRLSDLGRKSPLITSPQTIEPVVDNVLSLVQNSKPFDGIDVEKTIEAQNTLVNIDTNKITQVLLNLLLNAADACEQDGKVHVSVMKQSVDLEINNEKVKSDYMLISVEDNGSGIDTEVLKNIFEPFYTTKASGKGSGLGLSVCLSIIDQHKGWIDVKSVPGKGSTFTVFLPVSKNARSSIIIDVPIDSTPAKRQII